MNPFYRDYGDYLAERFDGKVQKLTVNMQCSCPNRDGTIGSGGCTYCNNASFSPAFTAGGEDVVRQLESGKRFFAGKYPLMRYLAYFQSYTNTHGDIDALFEQFDRAISVDGVVGLIIGTRPDCVDENIIDRLARLNRVKPVIMEYGAESTHDNTLRLVNRCHTWEQTCRAVEMTKRAGLDVGLHFIMGLPGESRPMMLETVDRINELMPDTVKFHQLQIIAHTRLAEQYMSDNSFVVPFSINDYLDLCYEIVARLNRSIAIERFTSSAPADLLIAPRWGIKNYEFTHRLHRLLSDRRGH